MPLGIIKLKQLGICKEVIDMVKYQGNQTGDIMNAISDLLLMFGDEDAWREVTPERVHARLRANATPQPQPQPQPNHRTQRAFRKYVYVQ